LALSRTKKLWSNINIDIFRPQRVKITKKKFPGSLEETGLGGSNVDFGRFPAEREEFLPASLAF